MTERGLATTWRRLAVIAALAGVIAGAGACDSARKQLGLTKNPPDEFTVVTRAPLVVPPDATLRPPEPGIQRPQELQPSDQAQAALFDLDEDQLGNQGPPSPAELVFLDQVGTRDGDPNIRELLRQENSPFAARDQSFVEELMFWREEDGLGVVVDAAAESERLRENADAGKPVTEGETPIITRRRRALLEDIF